MLALVTSLILHIFILKYCFGLCEWQEVYDWAGSIEDLPLHFTLQRRQEVILHEHPITEQEVLDIYERVSSTY